MQPAPALVSVILPAHNRAHLLGRAIQSVLAQTWRALELIVVDDASTDATPEVLASFSDPRLRTLRQARNGGAAAARNAGIAAARGEFLAFQDDDDIWLIEKLERQMRALLAEPDDVGLCLSGHFRLEAQGPCYVGGSRAFANIEFTRGVVGDFSLVATPGWLLRRRFLEAVGPFDERLRVWDDWELALRLSRVCRIVHLPEPLYIQDRIQGGDLVKSDRGHINDLKVVMEKHGALWQASPRIHSMHCLTLGRKLCMLGAGSEGRQSLRRAIAAQPFNGRAWLILLASFTGSAVLRRLNALARRARQLFELFRMHA